MLPALALTLALQVPISFDGLNIQVDKPLAPVTQGPTTAWQGKVTRFTETLATQTVGQYVVRVTDLSQVSPKPTAEQFLELHERAQKRNPEWSGSLFRTSEGKFGEERLILLNGTVTVNTAPRGSIGYVVTAALVKGDKAYEYLSITRNSEVAESQIQVVKQMTLGFGTAAVSVSGLPETTAGEYKMAGSPISIRCAGPIHPTFRVDPTFTVFRSNPSFIGVYEGAAPSDKKLNHTVLMASIKPEDKRTDDELLNFLSELVFGKGSLPATVKTKDGSATAEFAFKEGTYDRKGWLQFERKGQIVALLGAKTGPVSNFGGIELIRK